MALPGITDALQALNLEDPDYLLFCPSSDNAWLSEKFDEIPRYLFRVFTPNSRGMTDRTWTKSMDARDASKNSRVDIFARKPDTQMASMLDRHLRWWRGFEDNLVSWTSSLLFALVYIFHLHANSRDGSAFNDISLCIIDTTKFPKAVFLRDMDLIRVYARFDASLAEFKGLRVLKDWYFGEYLSQGALKIENKCQIVSAQAMIDRGLYSLRHEFEEFSRWDHSPEIPWAKPVVALRKVLYQTERPENIEEKLRVAVNIAQLFGQHWMLPVAANLAALIPPPEQDIAILQAFNAKVITDDDRENSSPLKTKVIVYESLPEVGEFSKIMRSVYKNFCVTELRNRVERAENQLRRAVLFAMNQSLELQDSALLDSIHQAVKGRLDMEAGVGEQLRGIICSRPAIS